MGAKKVLIIKPSSFGDVVHSLGLLDVLRRNLPDARIAWLVSPAFGDLLADHPMLDEVLLFERERWGGLANFTRNVGDVLRFARTLRAKRFDLVIDLQGLARSGLLTYLTGAPTRAGFANAREFSPVFYSLRVDVPDPEMHAVDRYLLVAKALGFALDGPVTFPVHVGEEARRFADETLRRLPKRSGPLVVLLPATRWETKRWPEGHFATLAERIVRELSGTVVLLGAPGDRALGERIARATTEDIVNLIGETTLKESAAVMERADAVVANDSGPMHLAVALGRPTVALFGPTRPGRTGPYGPNARVIRKDLDCGPCLSRQCPLGTIECMRRITPEEVFEAMTALM